MLLLAIAIVGQILGDGLVLYWLVYDSGSFAKALEDRLALAFILDVALTVAILAAYFARSPPGRFRWPWFVGLSLVGGVCFGLPFYWWLNRRSTATPT